MIDFGLLIGLLAVVVSFVIVFDTAIGRYEAPDADSPPLPHAAWPPV